MTTEYNIAVLVIQEIWVCSEYSMVETQIKGYTEVRSFQPSRQGGGVSLYIKEGYIMKDREGESYEDIV